MSENKISKNCNDSKNGNDSKNKKTIALVMMVKNEHKRIKVSLESVKDTVDCFVILDTGSEDDTMEIIRNYSKEIKKPLHMIRQLFPAPFDFSKSRNVLLDFADDKADYLLLLDCNDELRGGDLLLQFIKEYDGPATGYHLCQEWWSGVSLDKYYNMRFVKSKNNWRFKGAIHEYITCEASQKDPSLITKLIGPILFQDRTLDDDKSNKRFVRDEEIFHGEYMRYLEEYKKDNTVKPDTRMLFYYGQTCMCLGKHEKAYKLYRERVKQEGFVEEKYHAYFRCGEISKLLDHDPEETIMWYLKAYQYSVKIFGFPRVEPLVKLSEYYRDKCWDSSFLYLRRACETPYPESAILFVDRRVYEYTRWSLMGIVAFYIKQMDIGKQACLRAINYENNEIDRNNLLFYVGKDEHKIILASVDKMKKEKGDKIK